MEDFKEKYPTLHQNKLKNFENGIRFSQKQKFNTSTGEIESKPGFYIIQFSTGIKIGYSGNIKNRIRNYKRPWCRPIENFRIFYTKTVEAAQELETSALTKFYNRDGEYLVGYLISDIIKFAFEALNPFRNKK